MTLASNESAMESKQQVADRIFACIDEAETCRLAMDLAAIPSPTGDEAAIGEFILDWFVRHGFEPNGRVNVEYLRSEAELYVREGLLTDPVDVATIVDHRYVDYAVGRLGRR